MSPHVQSYAKLSFSALVVVTLMIYVLPTELIIKHFGPRARTRMLNKTPEDFVADFKKFRPYQLDIVVDPPFAYQRDFVIGSPKARVTIVEFSDFQCPYCQHAAKILKSIVKQYPAQVRLVFKNYPLNTACNVGLSHDMHIYACEAAKTARCAGLQGDDYFWEMHDSIFKRSDLDEKVLKKLPEGLGISLDEFNKCMAGAEVLNKIKDDIKAARKLNVRGTPSIFINGRKLEGIPLREDIMKKIIESELAKR